MSRVVKVRSCVHCPFFVDAVLVNRDATRAREVSGHARATDACRLREEGGRPKPLPVTLVPAREVPSWCPLVAGIRVELDRDARVRT